MKENPPLEGTRSEFHRVHSGANRGDCTSKHPPRLTETESASLPLCLSFTLSHKQLQFVGRNSAMCAGHAGHMAWQAGRQAGSQAQWARAEPGWWNRRKPSAAQETRNFLRQSTAARRPGHSSKQICAAHQR